MAHAMLFVTCISFCRVGKWKYSWQKAALLLGGEPILLHASDAVKSFRLHTSITYPNNELSMRRSMSNYFVTEVA